MTHTAIHPLTEKPQKPNPDTQLSTSVFSFNIIDKNVYLMATYLSRFMVMVIFDLTEICQSSSATK